MSAASKLKFKLQDAGMRGVLASAFRHAARRVDPQQAELPPEARETNDFLEWVRFVVPGWLPQGNVRSMEHAVTSMPPGSPILEIGSFCGLSTLALSHLVEKHSTGVTVFSCDKWEFEGQDLESRITPSSSVTHDAYRTFARDTFVRAMHTFAAPRLPHAIECFSDEFFHLWFEESQAVDVFGHPVRLGGEIGFCYIDGNHSYEFARRDFENTDRALVPGGFILFDDSADGTHWGVNQLVRELATQGTYEIVAQNPNYLVRKK